MACALKELPGKRSYLNDVTKYQCECSMSSENESVSGGTALEGIPVVKGDKFDVKF